MSEKNRLRENDNVIEAQDKSLFDLIVNKSTLQMHYKESE